jgi:hypothetical protein
VMEEWMVKIFSGVARHQDAMPSKATPEVFTAETVAECEALIRKYDHEARRGLADALTSPPKLGRPSRARGNGASPAEPE